MVRRLVTSVVVVALSVAFLPIAYAESSNSSITIAYTNRVTTLDPHTTTHTDTVAVRYNIFEGLVVLTPGLNIEPRLATSWSVSEDGKTYTFYLRKGVKFHDGTSFDAHAVKVNFDRVLFSDWDSSVKAYLQPVIDRVEVIDNYTVSIILKEPYSPFLNVIGAHSGLIASPKAIEEFGAEYGGLDNALVGTGPFKLSEWVKGDHIVLKRFENYWGKKPSLDEIIYRIIPEKGAQLTGLETGEIDVVLNVPPDAVDYLRATPGIDVKEFPTNRIVMFEFSLTNPPLDDVRVRKAINYAVDVRTIINNILRGAAEIADCPMAPQNWGYNSIMTYDYNPDKARELLAEAGLSEGFTMDMHSPKGRYVMDYIVAEAVQEQLSKVGIKCNLTVYGDYPTYLVTRGSLLERGPGMVLSSWATSILDADGALYQKLHSERAGKFANFSGYSNPEFDRLLNLARGEVDPEKRNELYRKAETIVMEDAPWLFMYYQHVFIGMRERVKGVSFMPSGQLIVRNVRIEE